MKPLAFVLLGCAIFVRRYRRRARDRRDISGDPADLPIQMTLALDPRDVVQTIDEVAEMQVMPLDVDAQSRADALAAQDLASLESEIDEIEIDDDLAIAMAEVDRPVHLRDAGDLYGAHTPRATDLDHPDDDRAFDEGQNWVEALETSAVEYGPEPEHELDEIVDDLDVLRPPHPTDSRDRPIADHGSGGRRGL
jgi:hypothetical protein